MITLIFIVAIVGYGFTLLSLFVMHLVYSKYWELHNNPKVIRVDDPKGTENPQYNRDILPATLHSLCGWIAFLSAIGTTVLLVILAVITLIQRYG